MIDLRIGSSIRLKGRAWVTCHTASNWLRVLFKKGGGESTKEARDDWWICLRLSACSSSSVGGSLQPSWIACWRRGHPAPDLPMALLPSRCALRLDFRELALTRTSFLQYLHGHDSGGPSSGYKQNIFIDISYEWWDIDLKIKAWEDQNWKI